MPKARKLPSGSWRTRAFDYTDAYGTKHYRSFTALTKKESEYLAAKFAMTKKKHHSDDRFHEALHRYIESREPVLSPATIRGYANIQSVLVKDYRWFATKKISNITQEDVQQLVNDLSRKRSPKTIRNYHGLISAVLGYRLGTAMPQQIKPQLYIPSDAEVRQLLAAVKDTELEIPILLGAFCALRRGEVCGLSIGDLSDDGTLHVHHSLVMGRDLQMHLKAPKTTASDRYISVPGFIVDKIRQKGHITTIKPDTITKELAIIQQRHGLPHFRFHDLRHYSASIMHALGIPDAYIMQRGGWSTDSVLKSVYRHALSDQQKHMDDIANKHFENIGAT